MPCSHRLWLPLPVRHGQASLAVCTSPKWYWCQTVIPYFIYREKRSWSVLTANTGTVKIFDESSVSNDTAAFSLTRIMCSFGEGRFGCHCTNVVPNLCPPVRFVKVYRVLQRSTWHEGSKQKFWGKHDDHQPWWPSRPTKTWFCRTDSAVSKVPQVCLPIFCR